MKKNCGLILIVSVLFGCNSSKPKENTQALQKDSAIVDELRDTITFSIEPIEEKMYCKASSGKGFCLSDKKHRLSYEEDSIRVSKLFEENKELVSRTKDELVINAKTGVLKFKNNVENAGDEYIEYQLREIHGNFITLIILYVESFEFMVVNTDNGKSFKTWGLPIFNTTNTMAVAGNYDLVAQFTRNGIQLFGQEINGWNLKMQKELDDWGPEDMFWINDSVILSKKNTLDETDSIDGTKTEFIKIVLKKEKVN